MNNIPPLLILADRYANAYQIARSLSLTDAQWSFAMSREDVLGFGNVRVLIGYRGQLTEAFDYIKEILEPRGGVIWEN